MHILYLHQHFSTPTGKVSTRSYELARRWVAAGHDVTMVCGQTAHCGVDEHAPDNIDGINLRVVNVPYANSLGFIARIKTFIAFMLKSFITGMNAKDIDVIYASSTPLTIGITAIMLKWCKRKPFVFEVRDQWPEIPIAMGYIKNRFAKKMLVILERRIYKSASTIVALSPGMKKGVEKVLGKTKKTILTAPNFSTADFEKHTVSPNQIRSDMNWSGKFIVLYFGAAGRANGLDFLLKVAEKVQNSKIMPNVRFEIFGEGSEKQRLLQYINLKKLTNAGIHEAVEKTKMPAIIAACNVATVTFANYPILQDNSANKFFDSLAAGKPVLLNYSGWQRELIEQKKCGFGSEQGDVDGYIKNLQWLHDNPEKLAEMGENARTLSKTLFNRDEIASQILTLLETTMTEQKH